jgi:hypothetical protein
MDGKGYVAVYESTDGGTGDPRKTFWVFRLKKNASEYLDVRTTNPDFAETARLAFITNNLVYVFYDENNENTLSQIKIDTTTTQKKASVRK